MTPTNPPSRTAPCPCGSGRKYKNCCMDKARAAAREHALRRTPPAAAAEHPWQAGIFPLATRVDDQPGRRVSVLLITADGIVLEHDMLTDPLGRLDEVVDALEAALEKTEQALDVVPRRLEVRHREVAQALGARLARRGTEVVAARRLPGLDDAARSLAQHVLGVEVFPNIASAPTWKGWGLSPTQCRALFSAAARFRRAEPWERLDDDPISVWGPLGLWTAAVMGGGGEAGGLSGYTDPRDFEELYGPRVDTARAMETLHG
ncbi:MAG: SEC-C domain-containing protein, partial [Gemmatimonadetes bacterium]|nr:SEC-C domain-containing protein [Gemmatimonadota bacterium]